MSVWPCHYNFLVCFLEFLHLKHSGLSLDLSEPSNFRDLGKPMGALDSDRLLKLLVSSGSDWTLHPHWTLLDPFVCLLFRSAMTRCQSLVSSMVLTTARLAMCCFTWPELVSVNQKNTSASFQCGSSCVVFLCLLIVLNSIMLEVTDYFSLSTAPEYMLCLQNGKFDHPDRMFNRLVFISY